MDEDTLKRMTEPSSPDPYRSIRDLPSVAEQLSQIEGFKAMTHIFFRNRGHGAFDAKLPRRAVLVTTGRLVGNAPDLFRDYNEQARERGEPEVELWDKTTLSGFLSESPDAIPSSSVGSMSVQL